MKSIIFSSVVVAVLILSGCSSKEVAVEAEKAQEVESVETETVVTDDSSDINESTVVKADSNEISMATVEGKLLTLYFDYDKFNIRKDMEDRLSTDSNIANGEAKNFMIKLEGNCDEWGSDEYNFALGLRRSNTVKNALVSEGVVESRITMVSYGESNPVCKDKTKECWSKNRRVDFKLLP